MERAVPGSPVVIDREFLERGVTLHIERVAWVPGLGRLAARCPVAVRKFRKRDDVSQERLQIAPLFDEVPPCRPDCETSPADDTGDMDLVFFLEFRAWA